MAMGEILEDNYVYVLESSEGARIVVDPGVEGIPGAEESTGVWVTHTHWDHVDGLDEFCSRGPTSLAKILPDRALPSGTTLAWEEAGLSSTTTTGDLVVDVLATPGHKADHVAYYIPDIGEGILFSGDVLFGLGCGRLFDGTLEEMHASLQSIAALPENTLVCSSHEYTETNLAFCSSLGDALWDILPGSPESARAAFESRAKDVRDKRASGLPTVPTLLGEEMATNPFLTRDFETFARLRKARDTFTL